MKTSKDSLHLLGNFRIAFTFYITKIRVYFINYIYLKEVLGIVMNFTQSISTCMRKYVTFSGRATRSEFWWFYLFTVLVNLVATSQASSFVPTLLDGQDMTENESSYFLNNFFFLYLSTITSLILLLPSLAVAVRRLHDVGRSGWWILIAFTVIGIIPLLIWYVTDTKDEENVYGPNPKTEDN